MKKGLNKKDFSIEEVHGLEVHLIPGGIQR